jgi:hypothetical protein
MRVLGIAACAMHEVDPGLVSAGLLYDAHPLVRGRALRTAGELGYLELIADCVGAIDDEDLDCQFWGAWSAVLLGDRDGALDALTRHGVEAGPQRARAYRLALQATAGIASHTLLEYWRGSRRKLRC